MTIHYFSCCCLGEEDYEERIYLQEFVSMDGKQKSTFIGLPIEIKNDLIPTKEQFLDSNNNIRQNWFDWGKTVEKSQEDDIQFKYKSKSLILAIPSEREFELLSQSCFPNESLQFLYKESSNMLTAVLREHLESILTKYPALLFHEEHKNIMLNSEYVYNTMLCPHAKNCAVRQGKHLNKDAMSTTH